MAIGTPISIGTVASKNSTTLTITGVSITAPSQIFIAVIASGNPGTPQVNIGSQQATSLGSYAIDGNIGATGILSMFSFSLTTSLVNVSIIASSLGGSPYFQAMSVWSVTGISQTSCLGHSVRFGTSANPSNTIASIPTSTNCIMFNVIGINGPIGDTFTQASGYTSIPTKIGTTGQSGTSNHTIVGGYITSSNGGSFTYTPTNSSNRAWIIYSIAFTDGLQYLNRYWVGGNGSWYNTDPTNTLWSYTSGGAPGAFAPGSTSFYIDGQAIINTPSTIVLGESLTLKSLQFSNGCSIDASTVSINTYGGPVLIDATVLTSGISGALHIFGGSVNIACQLLFDLYISNASLVSTINSLKAVTLNNMTSNYNITCKSLDCTGTVNLMADSYIIKYGDCTFNGAAFYCSPTSNIYMYLNSGQRFYGGNHRFNNLIIYEASANSTLTIIDSNVFNSISTPAIGTYSILFTAATTNTFYNWEVSGTVGNLITIGSSTAATHTLNKIDGVTVRSDYLNISNSTAIPADTWYAGTHSLNNGNNLGWLFTDAPIILSSSNFFLIF